MAGDGRRGRRPLALALMRASPSCAMSSRAQLRGLVGLVGLVCRHHGMTAAPPAQHFSTSTIEASVVPDGGIEIRLGVLRLTVSSTFTEGGSPPLLRALGVAVDPPMAASPWVAPITISGGGGTWNVLAFASRYHLNRTITVQAHRLIVSDTITVFNLTSATPHQNVVGIEITHRSSFASGAGQQVQGGYLPGVADSWACHSIADEEATKPGDRTTLTSTGNPTIHAHSNFGGVGMIPLDDVFETHSYGNMSAYRTNKLPVQSDPPAWRRQSNVCGNHHPNPPPCVCPVTEPPSISLVDPHLALSAGDTYTQEWAVYPLPASCPDYYCFINTVREDLHVNEVTMPGTGYLGLYAQPDAKELIAPAGFHDHDGDWAYWSEAELRQFYEREGDMEFVIFDTPSINRTAICGTINTTVCEGECFLDELYPETVARWQGLINKTRRLGADRSGRQRRVLVYQNSGIDTGIDAGKKHADCAITDRNGIPLAYRNCAAGQEMPLFVATDGNSWGTVKEAVYRKIMDEIGAAGIYHDEFLGDGADYTFNHWDNRSALLDPVTKEVTHLMGSIVLLSQHHEIKLMTYIKSKSGTVIANGHPPSRTLREYCRKGPRGSTVAGGPAGASLHFKEDGFQSGATHTHLFTPITLNRYGGQRLDLDPRYNSSCPSVKSRAPFMSAECLGRNIADNLDFGVLTFLYDGLLPNKSSSEHNVLASMFPMTARRLAQGLVVGRERVVSKVNGTALYDANAGEWHFHLAGSEYENRNPLLLQASRQSKSSNLDAVERPLIAVVRTFELGLLVANRTVAMGDGVAVRVANRNQIVIVALGPDDSVLMHATRSRRLKVDEVSVRRHWFLRGGVSHFESTANNDGTSYETAWRRAVKVNWAAIKPGDTLFVCGFGSGPFNLPTGFSGTPGGGEVTIDGNCPRPDGSVDQALWIGGDLVNSFPSPRWTGPDASGIYTTTYGGSASLGFAAAPNASEMSQLTRLARGACDASGPVNASAWPTQAFCAAKESPQSTGTSKGQKIFYKPASTEPVLIFGNLLGVLVTRNNSDVIIANLRMAFGARLLDVNGGSRITLINNTLQYASEEGISFNSGAGHKGLHPGTQGALVTLNRISDCACGLYIINQAIPIDNSQNSNDLIISWNNFSSIDPENFYGNGDTHGIGIQGGSRCVYEHNLIDGAGGSGITFYQGPGQDMEDNVARYNTIMNIRDLEGKKNQRGIEFCDDNRAGNHTDGNNSIYYNVLANVTAIGLRTKGRRSAPARGGPGPLASCTWRFLNNVVLDAGTAFELVGMNENPDAQGSCAINNIFACGLGAEPCSPGYRHQAGVPRDSTILSNNLYWPDNSSYFCAAGGCTDFALWAKANGQNAGQHSIVVDPQFIDAQSWPAGLAPKSTSAAVAAGRPVGLASDFVGATLPTDKAPDIGAFQVAHKTDDTNHLGSASGADGYVNQLTGLPALPKPHYASNSGIGAQDLANPARMQLWGEFARIAHSLPISLMGWGADVAGMKAVIALASQHNASIGGLYSPWYSPNIESGCKVVCSTCGPLPPGVCDPTVTANETQELNILREHLGNLTSLAMAHTGPNPVKVSMVFLDGERFVYNLTSPPKWKNALTRKHNMIYDLIKELAPEATVVQYGRGGLGRIVPDKIPIPNFHPKPYYPISAAGWPTAFYSGCASCHSVCVHFPWFSLAPQQRNALSDLRVVTRVLALV
jgi:hypothetical protein